jgi:hypothetical protein
LDKTKVKNIINDIYKSALDMVWCLLLH